MKWWIVIFVAALASAVQAQEQTAVQVAKHATGTLDYENVGEHDCKRGIEIPVRFVAKNVGLEILNQEPIHMIRIMRGLESSRERIGNPDPEQLPVSSDGGLLLDVDVTFCISPFETFVASGDWKVWNEDNEFLAVTGVLASRNMITRKYITFTKGINRYLREVLEGRKQFTADYFDAVKDTAFIKVSIRWLEFPRLYNADEFLPHIITAKATIELEPANTLEEESND